MFGSGHVGVTAAQRQNRNGRPAAEGENADDNQKTEEFHQEGAQELPELPTFLIFLNEMRNVRVGRETGRARMCRRNTERWEEKADFERKRKEQR